MELVVASEMMKMVLSVPLIFWLPDATSLTAQGLPGPSLAAKRSPWFWVHRLYSLLRNSRKVLVLVVLYPISNICGLTAVEFIGAPMFTVMCQMKIFTTAAFGVLLLRKVYSSAKWRALLLLVIGCLMVSSPILKSLSSSSSSSGAEEADMYGHSVYEQTYGLAAVTIQVLACPHELADSHVLRAPLSPFLLPLPSTPTKMPQFRVTILLLTTLCMTIAACYGSPVHHQRVRFRVLRGYAQEQGGAYLHLGAQLPAGLLQRTVPGPVRILQTKL